MMWLSWLGAVLQSERAPVGFPVSTDAWVVGSAPSSGACRRQLIDVSHSGMGHYCVLVG